MPLRRQWKHECCLEQPHLAQVKALTQWAWWNLGIRATLTFTFRSFSRHGYMALQTSEAHFKPRVMRAQCCLNVLWSLFCIISINNYCCYAVDISVANLRASERYTVIADFCITVQNLVIFQCCILMAYEM